MKLLSGRLVGNGAKVVVRKEVELKDEVTCGTDVVSLDGSILVVDDFPVGAVFNGGVIVKVNSVAPEPMNTLPALVPVLEAGDEYLLDRIGAVPPVLDILDGIATDGFEDVKEFDDVFDLLSPSDDALETLVVLCDLVEKVPFSDCTTDVSAVALDADEAGVVLDAKVVLPSIDKGDFVCVVELICGEIPVPGRIVIAMALSLCSFPPMPSLINLP